MPAARLLIGPLLRRVVGTRATVWVETSAPAVVTVRAAGGASGTAPTFSAYDHHYALVVVEGLTPDSAASYEVLIDDEMVWPVPESGFPPSVIRTRAADDRDQPVELIFGSCRETTQHATARKLPPGRARRVRPAADGRPGAGRPARPAGPARRPGLRRRHLADGEAGCCKRRRRRPRNAPADQVVSFDEYTKLYLESWRDPEIRWLLSTVPSVMIFDDHEIIDDWNTSAVLAGGDARAGRGGPSGSAAGSPPTGSTSTWATSPRTRSPTDPLYAKVVAAEDATDVLREFGERVDREADVAHDTERWRAVQYQWSYALDLGRTRLVMLDNRCSRVLEPGARAMLPPGEWSWFLDRAHGVYDHLVVGASLPWLLPPGLHHVEAWNERLADSRRPWVAAARREAAPGLGPGALGGVPALLRRARRALRPDRQRRAGHAGDRVGARPAYAPPASISVLSGDVHHSYVARARFDDPAVRTPVHQLTCSPMHNQVPAAMRPLMKLGWYPGPASAARALARSAGVRRPTVRWKKLAGPYFGNAVATLEHRGRGAEVVIEGTTSDGHLREVARQRLASVD